LIKIIIKYLHFTKTSIPRDYTVQNIGDWGGGVNVAPEL